MAKLVVRAFAVSVDGFSAGVDQRLEEPWGKNAIQMMNWAFPTKFFCEMQGRPGGEEGLDNDFAVRSFENVGATIMGRHMFGPDRGPWDLSWKGWWGDNPPFHHPVFVLSHRPRESFEMEGGTSFTFVTDGIESALEQAFRAAKGKDVRIGGGATTVRQYLRAGLIDELHLAQSPVLLGEGVSLFADLKEFAELYECREFAPSRTVTHMVFAKKS